MEGCAEYVGTWLGLSKGGFVTALINTNLRQEVLVHSIQAAGCKAVIFGSELKDGITCNLLVFFFFFYCAANSTLNDTIIFQNLFLILQRSRKLEKKYQNWSCINGRNTKSPFSKEPSISCLSPRPWSLMHVWPIWLSAVREINSFIFTHRALPVCLKQLSSTISGELKLHSIRNQRLAINIKVEGIFMIFCYNVFAKEKNLFSFERMRSENFAFKNRIIFSFVLVPVWLY